MKSIISALLFLILFTHLEIASAYNAADEQAAYQQSLNAPLPTDAVEQKAFPPVVIPPIKMQSLVGQKFNGDFANFGPSCDKRGRIARGVCLTSMNPKIATAASAITVLIAAMDATAGQKNSCEKFGSAMDIAKAAITAYTAGCGAARWACMSSCQSLLYTVDKSIAALKPAETKYAATDSACKSGAAVTPAAAACSEAAIQLPLVQADIKLLEGAGGVGGIRTEKLTSTTLNQEGLLVQCDKYQLKIAAGAAGLINIVRSAKGGKNCEDQLAANDGDGSLDCSKPENAKVVECMCSTNPTLAGCAGGGSGSNDPYQNLAGDYSESSSSSDSNVDLSATPAVDTTSAFASESASGGAAGFNAGGGGQGGIAGNGSGKAADGGKGTGKGLNKNILSGYEGGSGGGAGGSAGYSDDGYANQFKAFMPGGDKDPSRNPANAVFAGGQVTGAGSKSNWEKVSERYQANRPSFIQGGP